MPTQPSPTIAGTTTLSAIRTKVRRLTRSLSEDQLSTADIDNYINTFTIYDFPEQIRTFNLRTTFTFWCNAYQDIYPTDITIPSTDVLYNFQNKYISVHPPVYVAGFQAFYTQSPEQFWGIYPFTNSIASIGSIGDGVTSVFTGFVNANQATLLPGQTQQIVLSKNNVLFSSVDSSGNGLALVDTPSTVDNRFGNLGRPGQVLSTTTLDTFNFINYQTGQYVLQFGGTGTPVPPAVGAAINSQVVPLSPSRPQAVMYYANSFTVRPIPDQPYAINFEVYQRPTALLAAGQSPELEEYWQYISFEVAKKIFEDRLDMESVQLIMPAILEQRNLVGRRTIVQITNERTATIYTEGRGPGGYWGNGFGGGGI